jgi:hypothetical protein
MANYLIDYIVNLIVPNENFYCFKEPDDDEQIEKEITGIDQLL